MSSLLRQHITQRCIVERIVYETFDAVNTIAFDCNTGTLSGNCRYHLHISVALLNRLRLGDGRSTNVNQQSVEEIDIRNSLILPAKSLVDLHDRRMRWKVEREPRSQAIICSQDAGRANALPDRIDLAAKFPPACAQLPRGRVDGTEREYAEGRLDIYDSGDAQADRHGQPV